VRSIPKPVIVAILATLAATVAVALAVAPAGAKPAPHPYTLIDPGTLGGAQGYINLPGIPITRKGALLGTADTDVPDAFFPNFNQFIIGFPDPTTAHAFSYRNGHMTDLGALPGNNSSAVFQVNGNGVGAGLSSTGNIDPITGWPEMHAVIFKNGQAKDLGALPSGGYETLALAINDRGQVAGFGATTTPDPFPQFDWGTETHSFIWQDGVMRDIGTLGGPDAIANNMNERGQISGQSLTSYTANDTTGIPDFHPFVWEKGRMRDLGTLGGTIAFANWMSNSGQVTGFSTLEGDETGHAFVWNGKRMVDLGDLGGTFSFANYVNDEGHAVGLADLPDGSTRAFIWKGGKMRELPPPEGAPCSNAFAINNRDDVVGVADDCLGNVLAAVLWHKDVPYDLSTLIGPTQLTLDEPEFINDHGEIVGRGFLPTGEQHLIMFVPDPHGGPAALDGLQPKGIAASTRPQPSVFGPDHRCDGLPAIVERYRCSRR